jgi:ubiquinone/menaquinone biosynthesis C-methylase UbiE
MTAHAYLMESPHEGERLRQKTDLAFAEANLRMAGLRQGMRSIDVGCGIGMLTMLMHQISGHARTVGVDGSAARIEAARRRAAPPRTDVEFLTADIRALPHEDNSFDFSWSRFVFEYLGDPEVVLAEMKRVTRPGGVVAVADLDSQLSNFHPQSSVTAETMHEAFNLLAKHGFDPCVGRKLYAMFKRAGLHDIEATVVPYQTFCGGLPSGARENWQQKLAVAGATLTSLDPSVPWDELAKRVLHDMSREDSFYYSTLIVVSGTK